MYPLQSLTIQLYLFPITCITALKMTSLVVYLLLINVSEEKRVFKFAPPILVLLSPVHLLELLLEAGHWVRRTFGLTC